MINAASAPSRATSAGDAGALVGGVLARDVGAVGRNRGLRLRRAVGPGGVHRVALRGPQHRARLVRRRHQPRQRFGAVKPWVVAHHGRGREGLEIGRHAPGHEVANLEEGGVDLRLNLQGVSPVHEYGRLFARDHRGPSRAGEARRPGQPLVGLGQVFVLVLVLVRDDEGVEPQLRHLGADQRQVLAPEGRIGGLVEGLAHGRVLSLEGLLANASPRRIILRRHVLKGVFRHPRSAQRLEQQHPLH